MKPFRAPIPAPRQTVKLEQHGQDIRLEGLSDEVASIVLELLHGVEVYRDQAMVSSSVATLRAAARKLIELDTGKPPQTEAQVLAELLEQAAAKS